jgi:hypothetical protein
MGVKAIPPIFVVQVCTSRDASCNLRLHAWIALDKATYSVPVNAIPLRPYIPVGETANLVATTVPRLCNELALR